MKTYLKINFLVSVIFWTFFTKTHGKFICNVNDASDCTCVAIASGPTSQPVLKGTNTSLTCSVTNTEGPEVQWLQDGFALGTNTSIPGYPRYTMGNGDGGNYDLNIRHTDLTDQNTYECQVTQCKIASDTATLTVYVLPDGPIIENDVDGIVDIFTGITNTLTCHANNAKPTANVRWNVLESGDVLDSVQSETGPVDELYNSTSVYTFVPSKINDQAQYVCTIRSEAVTLNGQTSLEKIITLNTIEIPTSFTTNFVNTSTVVIDANQVRIVNCIAENTDARTSMDWYRGDAVQPNSTTQQYNVKNSDGTCNISKSISIRADETNDGMTYSCRLNITGHSKNYEDALTFTISVYYFPYAAVIGGSVGGVIFLILLIILLILCVKRSKKRKQEEKELRAQNISTFANEVATTSDGELGSQNVTPVNITPIEADIKSRAGADQGYDLVTETSKC